MIQGSGIRRSRVREANGGVGGEPEADEEVGGEPEADGEVGGEPEADEEAMGAAQRLQAAANEVRCGDSRIEGTELCDDGNAVGGDGCSADCQRIEPGFTCPNEQGVGGLCAVDNQIERIDTLDWLLPCDQPGCSVAHIGAAGDGHNLHFYLSERDARSDRGIAYHVKGADQRCWEQHGIRTIFPSPSIIAGGGMIHIVTPAMQMAVGSSDGGRLVNHSIPIIRYLLGPGKNAWTRQYRRVHPSAR